jgi:hypothetical protein
MKPEAFGSTLDTLFCESLPVTYVNLKEDSSATTFGASDDESAVFDVKRSSSTRCGPPGTHHRHSGSSMMPPFSD